MSNSPDDSRTDVVLPREGFVRIGTVLAAFPMSRSSFLQGVREGRYPAGVKLSPRVTAWRVEDIRALIANPTQGGF